MPGGCEVFHSIESLRRNPNSYSGESFYSVTTDIAKKYLSENRVFRTETEAEAYQKIQQAKLRIERWHATHEKVEEEKGNIFIIYKLENGRLDSIYIEDFTNEYGKIPYGFIDGKRCADYFIKEMQDDIMLVIGK